MVPGNYPYHTTLTILDVVMNDLASYRCVAANSIGTNGFTIELVVRSEYFESTPWGHHRFTMLSPEGTVD